MKILKFEIKNPLFGFFGAGTLKHNQKQYPRISLIAKTGVKIYIM